MKAALAGLLLLTGLAKGWETLRDHQSITLAGLPELVSHLGPRYKNGEIVYVDSPDWLHCHVNVMIPQIRRKQILHNMKDYKNLLGMEPNQRWQEFESRVSGIELSWLIYTDQGIFSHLNDQEISQRLHRMKYRVEGRQLFGLYHLLRLERESPADGFQEQSHQN
ncbi:MAG: hypothetical protein H6624_05765 [Bdellovibrionaceae bacterium]|nr:hypothetical protein [Bdellovibrionales bacterium]MCB9083828.1 hypothetical protein [Pseudobdellovibrionaceae bacterium]